MTHIDHAMHPHSLEALEAVRPKLGPRRRSILGVLEQRGAMTDRQIMEALRLSDMNSVRPRINEMIGAGVLLDAGERKCHVTGQKVRIVAIRRKPEQLGLL